MRELNTLNLQWATGAFCAALGALMLVAPHQFTRAAYQPLHPDLAGWGVLFLATGLALFATTVFTPPRGLVMAVQLLACTLLLVLAAGQSAAGGWVETVNYTLLGLGLAALVLRWPRPVTGAMQGNLDLFALVMGLSAVLGGLTLIALPRPFLGEVHLGAGPHLAGYGSAMLLAGALLLAVQPAAVRARLPRYLVWAVHGLAAAVFFAFLVTEVLPARAWASILYYGGFGALVAVLPGAEPHLQRLDPTRLQARVALLLVTVGAVPVVITAALMGVQEERDVLEESLDWQAGLARVLAQDVGDYLNLHRAALLALAAHPNLASLPQAEQQRLVEAYYAAHPDVTTFTLYNAAGNPVAVSGGLSFTTSIAGYPVFELARSTGQPSLDVLVSPVIGRPILDFGVPLRGPAGEFAGLATFGLEVTRVATRLMEHAPGTVTLVYLVDERGRAVAHPDVRLVAELADLSGTPAVMAALARSGGPGTFTYPGRDGQQLVAFARVPELDWAVVVERSAVEALADVRAGRDLVFGVLLMVLLVTAGTGVALAGWVTAPLSSLAHLARELAAGRSSAPLPYSEITEVAQLTAAFGEMRERLAQRTAEREQAQAELQRSEAQLRSLSARLQEMQEHERRRIAREVHDELGGLLTALKMDVVVLGRTWGGDVPEIAERTAAIASLIDQTVQTVRRIATDLRPGILDDFGLLAALEWQLEEFRARTGLDCHLESDVASLDIDRESATAIFRVFQEALTNIVRHAHASRVDVRLEERDGCLTLSVTDNGRGITEREVTGSRSLGLLGMRERVSLLAGELDISGQPGQGTRLVIRVPVKSPGA